MSKKLERKERILELYRKRRKIQISILVAMVVIIVFLIIMSSNPDLTIGELTQDNMGIIALFLVIGGFIFSFMNWRCPVCNKYLGRGIWQKKCGNCGTEFTEEKY